MALSMLAVLVAICIVSQFLVLQFVIGEADNVPFISFKLDSRNHVRLDGDAFFTGENVIQLTNSTKGQYGRSEGRVVYNTTIPLSNSDFVTHFQFQISDNGLASDGIVFFMASPEYGNHLCYGTEPGRLCLSNKSTNGNFTVQLVDVQFNTFETFYRPNSSHIGIDLDNITSRAFPRLYGRVNNSKIWDATIEYRKQDNILTVSAESESTIPAIFLRDINLTTCLPTNVVVGFSAAADASNNIHRIISWNFTANFPSVIPGSSEEKKKWWKVGIIAGSAISVAALFLSISIYCYTKGSSEKAEGGEEVEQSDMDIALENVPRNFTYSELCAGTSSFSEGRRLGRGGFGDVYRATLVKSDEIVAVKRISAGSKQGKREYLAEISTITRLRHRNLVQLLGWCHEKGQLLLVYEYMPNGSLDSFLFGERNVELEWSCRYRIAIDIASALLYLHESWDECVVHRDIKSSNVLLDSEFNAKVGDFGLARLVKHDEWFQTTKIVGTLGYLAPECAVTGISSTESDVFSFGAVALEIACGKPVLDHRLEGSKVRLVEWVWGLYGEGSLFDAADKNLREVFDRAELEQLMMIGLWCSHPDPFTRPKIRQVLQILNFEAAMPRLPNTLPKATYSSVEQGSFSQSSEFAPPSDSGSTDIPR